MKKQELESRGIVGVQVTFNHSEMIVLKGLINQITIVEEGKLQDPNDMVKMLMDVKTMVIKMLPENVMSIDEAYDSLFTDGAANQESVNKREQYSSEESRKIASREYEATKLDDYK